MKKRLLQILGSSIITALLLYAVFSDQSFSSFFETIAKVDLKLTFIYVLLSFLGIACRAERYRVILKDVAENDISPTRTQMLVVTLIRNGLVDLLPARLGEASFLYVCKRYGFSLLSALGTFGVCLALDVIILFGLLLLFFIFQLASSTAQSVISPTPLATIALLSLTVALSAILYYLDSLIAIALRIVTNIVSFIKFKAVRKYLDLLLEFGTSLKDELCRIKEHGSYPKLILLTCALRAAKYLGLYVLLLAVVAQFGISAADISPLLSTTAFIGAEASASLPISGLMGFGAYEAAWSAIFSISSVDLPSVAGVILAVHILTQVLGYSLALLGLFVFLFHEFRSAC